MLVVGAEPRLWGNWQEGLPRVLDSFWLDLCPYIPRAACTEVNKTQNPAQKGSVSSTFPPSHLSVLCPRVCPATHRLFSLPHSPRAAAPGQVEGKQSPGEMGGTPLTWTLREARSSGNPAKRASAERMLPPGPHHLVGPHSLEEPVSQPHLSKTP